MGVGGASTFLGGGGGGGAQRPPTKWASAASVGIRFVFRCVLLFTIGGGVRAVVGCDSAQCSFLSSGASKRQWIWDWPGTCVSGDALFMVLVWRGLWASSCPKWRQQKAMGMGLCGYELRICVMGGAWQGSMVPALPCQYEIPLPPPPPPRPRPCASSSLPRGPP